MFRLVLATAVLACTVTVAAPVPKEDDVTRLARVYGTPSEFHKPSYFELEGAKLRVFVGAPDGSGAKGAEQGQLVPRMQLAGDVSPIGAPRVWREVKGNFTLTAKVVVGGDTDEPRRRSGSRMAGLVVWAESNNYLGLARVGNCGCSVQLFYTHPNGVRGAETRFTAAPAEIFLRLKRVDATVTSGYSLDGKKWKDFFPDDVEWGDTIRVGVYAKNHSGAPFEATFDEYTLTVPK
jgi:regulation of enolase protein 1 (concanavalin A-like superfamily)